MRRGLESLLRLRLAALYALSLAAVFAALAAWKPAWIRGPLPLLPPLVLAAAALAGQALHDRLAHLSDRAGRFRFRPVGAVAHGAVIVLGLLGLLLKQVAAVEAAVRALVFLHPFFLLLAGLGRGHQGTLLNAVVLTCFAALAGGPTAAVAVVALAGLLVVFLAADRASRLLLDYPVREAPGGGWVLRDALPTALLLSGGLAIFFAAFPPRPFAAFSQVLPASTASPETVLKLLLHLLSIGLVAGVLFFLLLRWGGAVGSLSMEADFEKPAARRRLEPPPPLPAVIAEPPLDAWREKVVRLYLRTLEQLAKWGVPRKPSQTPAEYARRLEPAAEAGALASLFVRARYGADPLSEADFQAAEGAVDALLRKGRPEPPGTS